MVCRWVPVSPARFKVITDNPSGVVVEINGEVGESVHVSFVNASSMQVVTQTAIIQPNGRATVTQMATL